MEQFEKVFNETKNKTGTENIEAFAEEMYKAGMAESFDASVREMWKTGKGMYLLLEAVSIMLTKEQVKANGADFSISNTMTIDGKRYFSRVSNIVFPANEKKSQQDRAKDIAKQILATTPVYDMEDLLAKAVLAGYNLRKEDFGEE